MERKKLGINTALSYLRTHYLNKELPSIRNLALEAGVSFVTMWKALKIYKENYNTPQLNKEKDYNLSRKEEKTTASWKIVAEKIYVDVVTGRYGPGEKLPSCKELQKIYTISFSTLKKALSSLVEEKIIERVGESYFVPCLVSSLGHSKIVAIACGWEDGKIWVDYQDKSYFRMLESECIRLNLQLDLIVYFRSGGRLRFVHTASNKDYDLTERSILGYVFIVANLDSGPEEVLERLSLLKRNVAVLDVVGGWKIPRIALNNRLIRFFTTTTSELPAKRVAQYLLSKGHRKIAFFSPFHKAYWSQKRCEIIKEMFCKAGFPDGVKTFLQNGYAYQWDYLKNQGYEEDIRALINQYSNWKKEAHGEFFKRFGNLGYSIVRYMTEWNCASGEIYEKMKPYFEKALLDKSITAWVTANDFTATIAIDFLKEKGIRIPQDLSVISFDNTLDAMEYQLTSYDFNNSGIITMMLRFIIAPHTIKPPRNGTYIEVEGTLVIRKSTSSPPLVKN